MLPISSLTEQDLYLFNEGSHVRHYDNPGARPAEGGHGPGTDFAIWAPNAERVWVVGDFNGWSKTSHPLESRGPSGIWEGLLPEAAPGARYKYHLVSRYNKYEVDKTDPFAFRTELPPQTASVVWDLHYDWQDADWMRERGARQSLQAPIAIYEMHLGSWTHCPDELAHDGRVCAETLEMIEKLLATGRKLILVTGRTMDDLSAAFFALSRFHRVVAENGAILYDPGTRQERVLCRPPPEEFLDTLQTRGVRWLSTGRVIISTRQPEEAAVLAAIRDLGMELQVILNRGAVMVLPAGINKATGLLAALDSLGLSAHAVVGIGDAENDGAFLNLCECSVAVANALFALKEQVDWVTRGDDGAGVGEVIEELVANDLEDNHGLWKPKDQQEREKDD